MQKCQCKFQANNFKDGQTKIFQTGMSDTDEAVYKIKYLQCLIYIPSIVGWRCINILLYFHRYIIII